MTLFDIPVTLVRRGGQVGEDELGDPIYGGDAKTEVLGWIERATSTEDIDNREQMTVLYTLWLNGDVDLSGVDQVKFRDHTYEVVGPPGFQPGGKIVPGYTFASLRKVTG